MKLQIGIIIAFALLVNVYTFIKIRRKRKKEINTATGYRSEYKRHINIRNDSREDLTSNYKKQITKYNSTLDYVEKN